MAQNKHWNDIDTRILAERVTMVETMALVGRVKTAVSEGSG